jgi:hypothetical protein
VHPEEPSTPLGSKLAIHRQRLRHSSSNRVAYQASSSVAIALRSSGRRRVAARQTTVASTRWYSWSCQGLMPLTHYSQLAAEEDIDECLRFAADNLDQRVVLLDESA